MEGSLYVAPGQGVLPLRDFSTGTNNALLQFTGGALDAIEKVGTWRTNGVLDVPKTQLDGTKATINVKTGLIGVQYGITNASLNLLGAKAVGYGVVLQSQKKTAGFYRLGTTAGKMIVAENTTGKLPDITAISSTARSISRDGSTYSVSLVTKGDWTVVIPATATWVTASTLTGNGNATIIFTVAPNATGLRRKAIIKIAGLSHTIDQDYRNR
jgi:hypothetical protein